MKNRPPLHLLAAATACASLMSCASLGTAGAAIRKTTSAATAKVSAISDRSLAMIRPSQVPVVEVREKDLKEMPLGQERALAYEKSQRSQFWVFRGPIDFKLPSAPTAGPELDGSLLPPKAP